MNQADHQPAGDVPVAWEAILDLLEVGIVVLDSRSRLIFANPAAIELLAQPDATPGNPLAQHWRDAIGPLEPARGEFHGSLVNNGQLVEFHASPAGPSTCLILRKPAAPRPQGGKIAHDLNNIFGNVLMSSEIARSISADPELLSILERLEANARRGVELVRTAL